MIIENGPYTVYILTNKVNNKIYIGTTKRKLSVRFNNGRGYEHQKDFYADIYKYGWDNFEQEIFASNLTESEAFNMEKTLITKFREIDPDMLYNRDAGGKYGKHCEDTKEIIRAANVGRVITEEAKEKIRAARAKQIFSPEVIEKRNAKLKGMKRSPETRKAISECKKKKILCVETGKVYNSMTDASNDLHISLSCVSQQCKNIIPHAKGYHFEYV